MGFDNIDIMIIVIIGVITSSYIILISLYMYGWKQLKPIIKNNSPHREKISVIVPFRNEEENLERLINSILNQGYPNDSMELLLVNDHSTDKSIEIIEFYRKANPVIKLCHLDEYTFGKKEALKLGLKNANYNRIVFTDADCIASQAWFETISDYAQSGFDFIIGPVIMESSNSFFAEIQSLEYLSLMAVAAGSAGLGYPVIASSANLSFRKELANPEMDFLKNALSSGDDMFLLHYFKKIDKSKITFLKSNEAVVSTSPAKSIVGALKQRHRWASKSIHYTDFDTILSGLIVVLFNFCIFLLGFASFLDLKYLYVYALIFVIKSVLDFWLLFDFLKYFQNLRLLKVFIPLQVVYPYYLVLTFIASLTFKTNWKERTIK